MPVHLNRRRILSLWLPRLPIDRIQRVLPAPGWVTTNDPSIVVIKDNNALVIHALDEAAERLGSISACRSPMRGRCVRT